MKKSQVFNFSKILVEDAKQKECPRCKGFGGIIGDVFGCHLCNGYGRLWISDSGWTRALHKRLGDSQLY